MRCGRVVEGRGACGRAGERAGRLTERQAGGETGGKRQTGGGKLHLAMAQVQLFKHPPPHPPHTHSCVLSCSLFVFLPPDAARHAGSFVPHCRHRLGVVGMRGRDAARHRMQDLLPASFLKPASHMRTAAAAVALKHMPQRISFWWVAWVPWCTCMRACKRACVCACVQACLRACKRARVNLASYLLSWQRHV